MDIGNAIILIRKQKGFNQAQLSRKIGLSKNAMCQIEKNVTHPAPDTIRKIAMVLSVKEEFIYLAAIHIEGDFRFSDIALLDSWIKNKKAY